MNIRTIITRVAHDERVGMSLEELYQCVKALYDNPVVDNADPPRVTTRFGASRHGALIKSVTAIGTREEESR